MAVTIDLTGRATLVTGAGAGIGAEIAKWLGRAGAAVAVNDVRPAHAEAVVDVIVAEGGSAVPVAANCRVDGDIETMVAAVVDQLGGLDIAVNNIGMMAGRGGGPVVGFDGDYWRDIIDQNLVLTALCASAEARVMVEQGRGGVILNVSSGETTRPSPFLAAYGAAKAGINHLTQTMAVELGPAGIRVVAIAPGTTLTETVRASFDDARVAAITESNPLRRMTDADELGRLTVFLASDYARCITGQLILADAGAHLSRTRPPNLGG
ncbi:MAG TPA: SDR family oxidoreductase [Acidimicrobiales bacterium]|nr:SDR family oxidoreductase [Acidimicrobiales bacterium]